MLNISVMLSNLDQHIRFLDQTHSFVSVSSWGQFPWIIQVCLRLMRYLCCYVKDGLWPCKTQTPGCHKVCMHLRRKGYMIHELVLYGCTVHVFWNMWLLSCLKRLTTWPHSIWWKNISLFECTDCTCCTQLWVAHNKTFYSWTKWMNQEMTF